jgi:hypothetical protein
MSSLRFTTIIKIRGINPYIHVNAARARIVKPDWRKPLPVLVRINGKPGESWALNMMPIGDGGFYLYLHGDVRKAAEKQVGDRVDVEICFNPAYRNGPVHPMPPWFRIPLNKNAKAKKAWSTLTASRKKEILRYFSRLVTEEARSRNIGRALHVLSGKKGRVMARSWNE